jgi:two-component system, NtrC family, sensor kinase
MATAADGVLDLLGSGVFCVTETFEVTSWNRFMASNTGLAPDAVIGKNLFDCVADLPRQWLMWKVRTVFHLGSQAFSSWQQRPYVFRFPHNRPLTGGIDWMRQDVTFVPIFDAAGAVTGVAIVLQDATDAALSELALGRANDALKQEMARRQRLEVELRVAQRLEAVGQLAAGIAHEINTPLQFLGDGLGFLSDTYGDLARMIEVYRGAIAEDGRAAVRDAEDAADLDYLLGEAPKTLQRSQSGLARIAGLVRSMMGFGDVNLQTESYADLHRGLDATITITGAQYREVADLLCDYGDVPAVRCRIGELNQAFYNLIVNAAHAIAEARTDGSRGTIRIATRVDGGDVVISVADDGIGIKPEIKDRVFEPFFTTKEVGRGTGQGLSVTRAIVDRHGGALWFESEPGRGSTFYVRLPIAGASVGVAA